MRLVVTALVAAGLGLGQFQELATTTDGSLVYFSSNFRLRGSGESLASKIFMIDGAGAHLIAEEASAADLQAPSVAGDGSALVYYARRFCNSGSICAADERSTPRIIPAIPNYFAGDSGGAIISRNGRFAALYSTTSFISFGYAPTVVDLFTGNRVKLQSLLTSIPAVASNGTLLGYVNSPRGRGLALVDLQGQITIISSDAVGAPSMSDDGVVIVYALTEGGLGVRDASGNTAVLFLGGNRAVDPVVSGDGVSMIYRSTTGSVPQLFFVHADGSGLRQLTMDPAGIATATLSGNGKVAHAVTQAGAIVRIDTQTGGTQQLVGPAPRIRDSPGGHAPGSVIILDGSGLAPSTEVGLAPYSTQLGGVTATVAGLAAPLLYVSPERIVFQIPWEAPVEARPDVDAPPTRTSLVLPGGEPDFDAAFPFAVYALDPKAVQLAPIDPRTNYFPIAVHQDGSGVVTLSSPAQVGEIVTVYATGLGPVSPPLPDGVPAPPTPLSTITTPLQFSFFPGSGSSGDFSNFPYPATVFYAGLTPGFVGLYQINVRIPDLKIRAVSLTLTSPEPMRGYVLGDIAIAQP